MGTTNAVINTGTSTSQQNAPQSNTQQPPSPAIIGAPPGTTLDTSSPASTPDSGQASSSASSQPSQGIIGAPPGTTLEASTAPSAPSTADDASIAESGMSPEGQVAVGALKGVGTTVNGLGQIINKVTGSHIPDASQYLTADGLAQDAGKGIESVLEFMGGDEVLKGLPLAESLSKMSGIAKLLAEHPTLAKIASAGVTALRGGAVGATQGTVKTGGTERGAVEGGIGGAVGGVGEGLLGKVAESGGAVGDAGEAGGAAKGISTAAKNTLSLDSIQPALHQGIRDAVNGAAEDLGVTPSNSASIRDVAADVGKAAKAKSHGIFQQLDNAAGGTRFQEYANQLNDAQKELRNSISEADVDGHADLVEKVNNLEAAKEKAYADIKAQGLDPDGLYAKAQNLWKRASAVEDLGANVRTSLSKTSMRPELAADATKAKETLSPDTLMNKANKLYDKGRLQTALGEQKSKQLMQALNEANLKSAAIKAHQAALKWATGVAGVGAVGDWVHSLFSK